MASSSQGCMTPQRSTIAPETAASESQVSLGQTQACKPLDAFSVHGTSNMTREANIIWQRTPPAKRAAIRRIVEEEAARMGLELPREAK